jgi:hypothetical protein
MVTPNLWIFLIVKRHPPPTKKRQQHDKIKQVPKSRRCDETETVRVIIFQWYVPIIIFTSPVVIVDGGIHGDSPSGIVCSSIGIDNATDVASLLTVVLMVIPPVAVEEAVLWTVLNYQARVICANVIDCINCTFDKNRRCVYIGPAFF